MAKDVESLERAERRELVRTDREASTTVSRLKNASPCARAIAEVLVAGAHAALPNFLRKKRLLVVGMGLPLMPRLMTMGAVFPECRQTCSIRLTPRVCHFGRGLSQTFLYRWPLTSRKLYTCL